ncbi:MAG: type IV secretion system protein [Phascolarctobacterium sp.]|nr:type IV secretion system protein [Phascolarctobacterium sp.]
MAPIDFASEGVLNSLVTFFENASVTGFLKLQPYAMQLLYVLAIIDICSVWALYRGERLMETVVSRIMKLIFLLFTLTYLPDILSAILHSFEYAGLTAGGLTPTSEILKPSSLLDKGFEASGKLLSDMSSIGLMDNGGIAKLFMLLICSILTIAAYFFMAFQIVVSTIEFHIFSSLAVILLPFGVLKFTEPFFRSAIRATMTFAMKLMVVYFMIALVTQYGQNINKLEGNNFALLIKQALGVFVLGLLVAKIPQVCAQVMEGGGSMSGSGTIGAMSNSMASIGSNLVAGAGGALGMQAYYKNHNNSLQETLGAAVKAKTANVMHRKNWGRNFKRYSDPEHADNYQ